VSFIALLLSFSTHITVTLLASLVSFLAALLTLIAFAIDIALFAFVKHELGTLNNSNFNTNTAPAFWLTFASFLLLLLAGCTVCFGRRRQTRLGNAGESGTGAPYKSRFGGLFSRFRRTPRY
jgi:ABC-type nickel/cobalt efflux system permease component RcnA